MNRLKRWMHQPGDTDPTGCLWMLVAAVVALTAVAVLVVVHMVRDAAADQSEHVERLVTEQGAVSAHTPPADGTRADDRIQAFVAVRDDLTTKLEDLEHGLGTHERAIAGVHFRSG